MAACVHQGRASLQTVPARDPQPTLAPVAALARALRLRCVLPATHAHPQLPTARTSLQSKEVWQTLGTWYQGPTQPVVR